MKKINPKNLSKRSFTDGELLMLLGELSMKVNLYSYSRILDLVEELTGDRENLNKEIKKFKVHTETKPQEIRGNVYSSKKELEAWAFDVNDIKEMIKNEGVNNVITITSIEEIEV